MTHTPKPSAMTLGTLLSTVITRETHKGSVSRVRIQTLVAIQQLAESVWPEIKNNLEELRELNKHLDSRTQQHWDSYNQGCIAALKELRQRYIKIGLLEEVK